MSLIMNAEELYRNLETALNLPVNSITSQNAANLSFNLDSMGAVLLTSFFDSELGIVVDTERLMKCHSVNDLMQLEHRDS